MYSSSKYGWINKFVIDGKYNIIINNRNMITTPIGTVFERFRSDFQTIMFSIVEKKLQIITIKISEGSRKAFLLFFIYYAVTNLSLPIELLLT